MRLDVFLDEDVPDFPFAKASWQNVIIDLGWQVNLETENDSLGKEILLAIIFSGSMLNFGCVPFGYPMAPDGNLEELGAVA